jgi:ubiquinone/menaquinone biosynthesis C-methylase UbiE
MMDALFHTKIQHSGWNKAAPFYNDLWQRQLQPAQNLLLKMATIQTGEDIADICCGTGLVSFLAAELTGPNGKVIATDFAEEMLAAAKTISTKNKFSNIRFQQMDAENLNLPDQQFDVGLNALGLMYLADPAKAVNEMYRILRKGGRALALVWGSRDRCGWADIFHVVDKRVTTEVCPLFFQTGTGHVLEHLFKNAGFSNIEEKRLSCTIHFSSDGDASDAMFIGGPVALAWKHFDENTRTSARQEYLSSLGKYKNETGYYVPAEFVIVKGMRN